VRKSVFLAGLIVLGTGFFIVLLGIGIIHHTGVASPHWLLGLAGMAFVVGGGLVCIGELLRHDDARELRDLEVARAFRNVMIGFLMIIFVILGNWVAFGPGTRPVETVIGLPFFDVSAKTGEWVGRFGFGISALSLDFLLAFAIVAMIRKVRAQRSE
jgi:hypothetical protein